MMIDFHIDARLDQSETMYFKLPMSDPKVEWVEPDVELEYAQRRYFVRQMETEHVDGIAMLAVEADALWYRLGDITKIGTTILDQLTPAGGLLAVLDGTGWTVGPGTVETGSFTLELDDASVLKIIRQWAKITGTEVVWDTVNRTVALVADRGFDRGVQFRYGRNLKSILKRETPPMVTRLYGYGADDLNVAGVNGGVQYVEDFSWYTARGVDLDAVRPDGRTNREHYTKTVSLYDDRFLVDTALLAYMNERIAELSAGEVAYEAKVIDLALNPSRTELESIVEGDRCRVVDSVLGFNVLTTVVRMDRYPLEPDRNVVELSSLPSTLSPAASSAAGRTINESWELFTDESQETNLRLDATWTICRIPLRFREGGEMIVGGDMRFTGVGAGTLYVQWIDTTGGNELYPSAQMEFPYTDGQEIHATIPMPLARKELSGSYDWRLRMQAVADGGPGVDKGVNVEANGVQWWMLARRAVRETPTSANTVTFNYIDYDGGVQKWTVPDGVEGPVTILCEGSVGGNNGSGRGGLGGRITGVIPNVVPGTVYDIYVGGGTKIPGYLGTDVTAGWPGGGEGGVGGGAGQPGYGGGGCTYVVEEGGGIGDALIVAGGGGGASARNQNRGGDARLVIGDAGVSGDAIGGGGGSQVAGGAGGSGSGGGGGASGGFGTGGDGGDASATLGDGGGGGGAGYYGGGGGGATGSVQGAGEGGGGGGAGYIDFTRVVDVEVQDAAVSTHGKVVISWPTQD